MQTFLPYPDFGRSVAALDRARLGKQRVEAMQILKALAGETRGWVNHPATRMWRGFAPALAAYHDAAIREWVRRGYRNTMPFLSSGSGFELPPWFGDPDFHASHRSALLRKLPEHYRGFGWPEPDDLPYVWPA